MFHWMPLHFERIGALTNVIVEQAGSTVQYTDIARYRYCSGSVQHTILHCVKCMRCSTPDTAPSVPLMYGFTMVQIRIQHKTNVYTVDMTMGLALHSKTAPCQSEISLILCIQSRHDRGNAPGLPLTLKLLPSSSQDQVYNWLLGLCCTLVFHYIGPSCRIIMFIFSRWN